jgi:hypothetical protein
VQRDTQLESPTLYSQAMNNMLLQRLYKVERDMEVYYQDQAKGMYYDKYDNILTPNILIEN